MKMSLKYEEKEIRKLYNLVESADILDCIVHHVEDILVTEAKLKNDIRHCRTNKISNNQIDRYLKTLSNAGVLDCIITPRNDMLNYKISSLGKRVKNEIEVIGSKYNHP